MTLLKSERAMSAYPAVDQVIEDLKRLDTVTWTAPKKQEIAAAMVDARRCLIQLLATVEQLQSELADAKKWAMAERAAKWQALASQPE
jgi:hypothetical protein